MWLTLLLPILKMQSLWILPLTQSHWQFSSVTDNFGWSVVVIPVAGLTNLVPRPLRPAFVACNTKSGEKAWTDLSRDACHC